MLTKSRNMITKTLSLVSMPKIYYSISDKYKNDFEIELENNVFYSLFFLRSYAHCLFDMIYDLLNHRTHDSWGSITYKYIRLALHPMIN